MYDALESVQWMLAEAREAVLMVKTPDAEGKLKKKAKVEREADRARFLTLCEVLWNTNGRPEPLEALTERMLSDGCAP